MGRCTFNRLLTSVFRRSHKIADVHSSLASPMAEMSTDASEVKERASRATLACTEQQETVSLIH